MRQAGEIQALKAERFAELQSLNLAAQSGQVVDFGEISRLMASIKELEEALKQAETREQGLRAQANAAAEAALQAQATGLKSEIAVLEDLSTQLGKQIEKNEEVIATKTKQAEALEEKSKELDVKITDNKIETEVVRAQKEEKIEEKQKVDDKITTVEATVEDVGGKVTEKQKVVDADKVSLDALREERKKLREERAKLEKELGAIADKESPAYKEKLSELGALSLKESDLQKRRDEKATEEGKKLIQDRRDLRELKKEHGGLTTELGELKGTSASLGEQIDALSQKEKELEATAKVLLDEKKVTQEQAEKLRAEAEELRQKNEVLKEQKQEVDKELQKKKEELKEVEAKIEKGKGSDGKADPKQPVTTQEAQETKSQNPAGPIALTPESRAELGNVMANMRESGTTEVQTGTTAPAPPTRSNTPVQGQGSPEGRGSRF
jgi:chromosome segregation ATPase